MRTGSRRLSVKSFIITGLAVALVLGGAVSYFASGAPDGLGRVAEDTGIAAKEQEHSLAEGPFAGYRTKGVGAGWLSGGVAGVVGVTITFAVAGALFLAVRRRGGDDTKDDTPTDSTGR